MTHSTKRPKPAKPYRGFPLFPHATGRWAKKIRGRLHYFGPWNDPDGALQRYLDQRDDLHAGRTPRPDLGALTVRQLVNRFLNVKHAALTSGELTARSFRDYHRVCGRMVEAFGREQPVSDLRPEDFERLRARIAQKLGLIARKAELTKVRTVFLYAFKTGLIDKPMHHQPALESPRKAAIVKARRANGAKVFTAQEVRTVLEAAGLQMRAMVLMALNTGFGNYDLATLPLSAVDLERGWVEHARPKTGADRRCPLWAETVEALREVIARRPKPKDPANAHLVFLTPRGLPWVRTTRLETPERAGWSDGLAVAFRQLLLKLGLNHEGRGFYGLRHTFRTVADGARDQAAVGFIMGHVDPTIAGVYRDVSAFTDDRLRAVVAYVRQWLFGQAGDD